MHPTTAKSRTRAQLPAPDLSIVPDGSFLVRSQVAKATGFSEQVFKKWAREGRGPKITYLEGKPRYLARDLREWAGLAGR